MKAIIYCNSAKKDIASFPVKAKVRIARLLEMLRDGVELNPKDFKYIPAVGMGSYELRVRVGQQYLIFYVVKFDEAIYVLHAFSKKTQATAKQDIELGKKRYKAMIKHKRGQNV